MIICNHCIKQVEPVTEKIPLPAGGFHLKASCPICGMYIKFLSHSIPEFHFGKHKGELMADVWETNPEYMQWLLSQEDIRPTLKKQLEESKP